MDWNDQQFIESNTDAIQKDIQAVKTKTGASAEYIRDILTRYPQLAMNGDLIEPVFCHRIVRNMCMHFAGWHKYLLHFLKRKTVILGYL